MLEAQHLTKRYVTSAGHVAAVIGIDLKIRAGEFAAIMGPSGSGKTTLLSMLGALEPPSDGRVLLRGQDISEMSARELANLRRFQVGFVFQSFHLVDHLTAFENIRFPLGFNADLDSQQRDERARELLAMMGLEHRADHFPRQMSGGEKQRVAIARAMANRPAVILADEPTGNLDQKSGDGILEAFESVNREFNQTLVLVTHDPRVSRRAERVIYLEDGRVAREYRPDEEHSQARTGGRNGS